MLRVQGEEDEKIMAPACFRTKPECGTLRRSGGPWRVSSRPSGHEHTNTLMQVHVCAHWDDPGHEKWLSGDNVWRKKAEGRNGGSARCLKEVKTNRWDLPLSSTSLHLHLKLELLYFMLRHHSGVLIIFFFRLLVCHFLPCCFCNV